MVLLTGYDTVRKFSLIGVEIILVRGRIVLYLSVFV